MHMRDDHVGPADPAGDLGSPGAEVPPGLRSRGMAARLRRAAILAATGGLGLGSFFFGPAAADAAPAQPAQPTNWVITPTGHFTGTASFGSLSSTGGTTGQCFAPPGMISASGSVPASMVSGNPADVAELGHVELSGCSIGGVSVIASVPSGAQFEATGYDSGTGVATGFLSGIDATVTGVGNPCAATLSGSLSGSYNNETGQLTVDPGGNDTLNIETASGCSTLQAGKQAKFNATFTVSPKLTITGS